ncbi:MAG: hypothetical protein LBP62_04480 [Clostridiales bacterium]|nr:hypothetical protein [Clostridiales bacterium]
MKRLFLFVRLTLLSFQIAAPPLKPLPRRGIFHIFAFRVKRPYPLL